MKKIILILMIITAFISYLRANAVGIIQNIPAPTNLKLGIINNPEVDGKTTPGPWPRIKTVYWPDGSKTANYKTIQIPISWTLPSRIKAAHFTIDSNKQLHAQPSVKGYFEEIQVRIESPQKPDWNQWVTIKGGDFCPDDPDQKVWMLRPARSGYDIAITEDLNPKKPIPIIAWNNNDAGHAGDEPTGFYYFRVRLFKYFPDLKTKQYSDWSNELKVYINPSKIY